MAGGGKSDEFGGERMLAVCRLVCGILFVCVSCFGGMSVGKVGGVL